MATETPAPVAADPAPIGAEQPVRTEPVPRRTVTLPVLPLVIIGAVIAALVFFGGGIALGVAIGDSAHRAGNVQPFGGQYGQYGPNRQNGNGAPGGQNGFGQNRPNGPRGQNGNGQGRPTNGPTSAPQNG
jgi:hypothetical protein